MNEENGLEDKERKDLPENATPRERVKYIKELTLFYKSIFSNISYNDIQNFLDKIIKVCNDSK